MHLGSSCLEPGVIGVCSHPNASALKTTPQKVSTDRVFTVAAEYQQQPTVCPVFCAYWTNRFGKHALHAGAQHRRFEGGGHRGAISSRVKPPTSIDGLSYVSALRETNLFPVHLEKSAQVTPCLQGRARAQAQALAKAQTQQKNGRELKKQQLLPPFASQYDPARSSAAREGARVPARSSVRARSNAAALVENMRKAQISGSQAYREDDDVEVVEVEHTGCVSLSSLNGCKC